MAADLFPSLRLCLSRWCSPRIRRRGRYCDLERSEKREGGNSPIRKKKSLLPEDEFASRCFSPDKDFFVVGYYPTLSVWKCSTWTCVATLHGHFGPVCSVAFQSGRGALYLQVALGSGAFWAGLAEGMCLLMAQFEFGICRIEFDVEVKEGPHESAGCFRQGIPLGGWVNDEPICIRLPEVGVAVELLN